MSAFFLISIIILVGAVIVSGVAYYYLLKRARKAYWDLYNKVGEVQQQMTQVHRDLQSKIGEVQQQATQLQQQAIQIQQHLLLDQVGIMTNLAKESDYINDSSYKKVIEKIHELKMDNFSGENVKLSENH